MKLIIAGPRDRWVSREFIDEALRFYSLNPILIISGGAHGIDECAVSFAEEVGLPYAICHADWSVGKKAGPIRNKEMALNGDVLLAFWNYKSKGTKNMIETMAALNKPVYVITIK